MNRRKFLTGIAGVTASGAVLAKDPVTTQLSPPIPEMTGSGNYGASIMSGPRILRAQAQLNLRLKNLIEGQEGARNERSPFTNWTMQIQQPTDNYFRHGDGLVDIDGRFRLAKFYGEQSPLLSKPTSVVIKAGKKWVTVVSLQHDEIY